MNNENLKENQQEFSKKKKQERWWNDDMRIKTETGVPDLLIFLLNANLEKNRSWIYFVILNLSQDEEEKKIRLLRLFFLMRSLPLGILKENFPREFEIWKDLRKRLDEDWIAFSKQKGFYQSYQLEKRKIKFRLFFNKFKTKKIKKKKGGEKETSWQEWETLSKASSAYNFHLLGEVICNVLSYFSEERKIKKLPTNEEVQFKIEPDIDHEKVPDILITSEKDKEERLGIEVVEVSSSLSENYGDLDKFVPNRVENQMEEIIESQGKKKIKPLFDEDLKEVVMNKEHKEYEKEVKKWVKEGGKDVFKLPFSISRKINKIDYLMEKLKETIKEKNEKWKKKRDCIDLKKTALWTVLSASFSMYLYQPSKGEMTINQETQRDFLSWFLLKKLSENLSDTKIEFGCLVITFLNLDYCSESSFLSKHDPFKKVEHENTKNSSEILKLFMKDDDVRVVIPTFYIPVRNGKIKDLKEDLKKLESRFKEKWNFHIKSLIYEEFGPRIYNFYAQNLKSKNGENQKN